MVCGLVLMMITFPHRSHTQQLCHVSTSVTRRIDRIWPSRYTYLWARIAEHMREKSVHSARPLCGVSSSRHNIDIRDAACTPSAHNATATRGSPRSIASSARGTRVTLNRYNTCVAHLVSLFLLLYTAINSALRAKVLRYVHHVSFFVCLGLSFSNLTTKLKHHSCHACWLAHK